MSELFLKIINMSISASWLVLAVLILRLILKKAPKWIPVLLWGIVAIRLIFPFSIESPVSLIPDSVGSGELVSGWMDDYIGDIDIHHPNSVYYDAVVGSGREPIYDSEGGYYVVTKHDQLGELATVENTIVLIGLLVVLFGAASWYLKPVGTIEDPEWDILHVDGITYISERSAGIDIPYSRSDRGMHIGIIKSGEHTFHIYEVKGDSERNYLYWTWEWEGEMYVRQDMADEWKK